MSVHFVSLWRSKTIISDCVTLYHDIWNFQKNKISLPSRKMLWNKSANDDIKLLNESVIYFKMAMSPYPWVMIHFYDTHKPRPLTVQRIKKSLHEVKIADKMCINAVMKDGNPQVMFLLSYYVMISCQCYIMEPSICIWSHHISCTIKIFSWSSLRAITLSWVPEANFLSFTMQNHLPHTECLH